MSDEQKDSNEQKEVQKLVPVINVDLRNKIKKDVPFLEGAWVEFYDDLTVADQKVLQTSSFGKLKRKKDESDEDFEVRELEATKKQGDTGQQLTVNLIASWNFADDKNNIAEIDLETFKILPLKLQRWILRTTTDIIKGLKDEDFEEEKKN